MSLLLKSIAQSNNVDLSDVEFTESIPNLQRVGDRQSVYPSVLWNNGSTFMVGDKPHAVYKNQIVAIQYNHNFGWFDTREVGNGTTTQDTLDHSVPFVRVESNSVYTGQTDPHNEPIRVYKSDVTNTIQNGFTEIDEIGTDEAYPQVFTDLNGKTVFYVRDYDTGSTDHNLSVLVSASDIEDTFTNTVITSNESDYWFYNFSPILYGTQTVHYVLATMRNTDAGGEYFAHGILKTSDWITFSNYDDTFSKDVVNTAPITWAEFNTNCIFNGSTANDELDLNRLTAIQVDDTLYLTYKDASTEVYQIASVFDGTFTNEVLEIDNLNQDNFYTPFLYWNGTNIVVSAICDNGGTITKELWAVSTDFQTHTRKYTWENPVKQSRPILIPENLDIVNGQYMMVVDNDTNEATFVLTIDKFRL